MAMDSSRQFKIFAGGQPWANRLDYIRARLRAGANRGKFAANRFYAECAIEKAERGQKLTAGETAVCALAAQLPELYDSLSASGQNRLRNRLDSALDGEATIMPLLHLLHTAQLQRMRGFAVAFSGFEDATAFDLLITRNEVSAEIACDDMSAEVGHAVPRSSWAGLIDHLDPDLQTWLAAHPGRYLLKMTLPQGLPAGAEYLPALHSRINTMLAQARRADYDEAAILRLDPLLLAGAQAGDVMNRLRDQFGPEAHFSVTEAGPSMLVMAARGGIENKVAASVRRRLQAIAPARLTGTRPGILAMFIEDTDQLEWRTLREQLLLEGETRQFLTFPEAKPVIAVTLASRHELTNTGAPGGDLRYRNPMHPAAKSEALAPAVLSTV
jgi:hypothetical protein